MAEHTRKSFSDELARVEEAALGGLDLVGDQLERVLEALENQDVELAGMVVANDEVIDVRYLEVHQSVLSLFALQAPVATDLRIVAALLHVIRHVERMGDQCVTMAKLIPLSGNEPPVHDEILSRILRMGRCARTQVTHCKLAFGERNMELAEDLVRQ